MLKTFTKKNLKYYGKKENSNKYRYKIMKGIPFQFYQSQYLTEWTQIRNRLRYKVIQKNKEI